MWQAILIGFGWAVVGFLVAIAVGKLLREGQGPDSFDYQEHERGTSTGRVATDRIRELQQRMDEEDRRKESGRRKEDQL